MISLAQSKHTSLQPTKQIKRTKTQQGSKRRAKRACVHCKKAKTSCSNSRPCERCVRLNLADTCMDPPHSDITNEDRQLWETTLKVLTENKPTNQYSQEQKQLMEMLQTYAQRVSQPIHVQDTTPTRLALDSQPSTMGKIDFLLQQNDYLSRQVEFLTRQMELSKTNSNQLVKRETLYQFSLLSTTGSLAYSRWTFPEYVLLDYNHGFLELSGQRNPEIGRFNCANLFMVRHLFACGFLVMLLRDGIVKSVEVNQLWSVRGQEVPVKAIMVLNFDSTGAPVETVMYCKRSQYPFPTESLFKPLEFEMSKKSKENGFTADHLRRLFHRSCEQPSVDSSIHEKFSTPGSITVQALMKLDKNPMTRLDSLSPSVSEQPPSISETYTERSGDFPLEFCAPDESTSLSPPSYLSLAPKGSCPLRAPQLSPTSPISSLNDWNFNHGTSSPPLTINSHPINHNPSSSSSPLLSTMNTNSSTGNLLDSSISGIFSGNEASPPASSSIFGLNDRSNMQAPSWGLDPGNPFGGVSLVSHDDDSSTMMVEPQLGYNVNQPQTPFSSEFENNVTMMMEEPTLPGDPALDEFFRSSGMNNTNDEIFDKFFDNSVSSTSSLFPVEESSNWSSSEDHHAITLNNFL